jgi:hypothetical protein
VSASLGRARGAPSGSDVDHYLVSACAWAIGKQRQAAHVRATSFCFFATTLPATKHQQLNLPATKHQQLNLPCSTNSAKSTPLTTQLSSWIGRVKCQKCCHMSTPSRPTVNAFVEG